jgi:hypothetical protein
MKVRQIFSIFFFEYNDRMYASNFNGKLTNDHNKNRILHTAWIEHLEMNPSKLKQGMSGRPLSKEWLKVRLNQELYDLFGAR